MVPLLPGIEGGRTAPNTRSNQTAGSRLNQDQIAAQLAAIASRLESIGSQLKGVVEALKTEIIGTPLRCNNQSGDYESHLIFYEYRDDKEPAGDPHDLVTDRVKDTTDMKDNVAAIKAGMDEKEPEDEPRSPLTDLVRKEVRDDRSCDDKDYSTSVLGVELKIEDLEPTQDSVNLMSTSLQNNMERMKNLVDLKGRQLNFEVGDVVFPPSHPYRHFKAPPPRSHGPYCIISLLGAVNYEFEVPWDSRVHSVSHVSLLKLAQVQVIATPSAPLPITKDWDIDLQPQSIIEWLIAWHNNSLLSDLWTSRLSRWDVLIRTRVRIQIWIRGRLFRGGLLELSGLMAGIEGDEWRKQFKN